VTAVAGDKESEDDISVCHGS